MIRFLKRLLKVLERSANNPQPYIKIKDEESVSRFLLQKSHYAKEKGRVKYGAFLPNTNAETSVCRTMNLDENDIWKIGTESVANPQRKKLLGRANISVENIYIEGLGLIPTPKLFPRHADITNWPTEKHDQQMKAVELANKSKLILCT